MHVAIDAKMPVTVITTRHIRFFQHYGQTHGLDIPYRTIVILLAIEPLVGNARSMVKFLLPDGTVEERGWACNYYGQLDGIELFNAEEI